MEPHTYSPLYLWASQTVAEDCLMMDCPDYNPYKDFKRDPTGFYVLIKVNFAEYKIELALCNKDHKIVAIFKGRKPQDVTEAIFDYEKKNNVVWFKEKGHIAYLGKELKKAEIALATGQQSYFQE